MVEINFKKEQEKSLFKRIYRSFMWIFFFPGITLHELSHLITGFMFGFKVEFINISLNGVEIAHKSKKMDKYWRLMLFKHTICSISPLFVLTGFLFFIHWFKQHHTYNIFEFFYMVGTLVVLFPSNTDLNNVKKYMKYIWYGIPEDDKNITIRKEKV